MVKVEMSRGAFFLLAFIGYILPVIITVAVYLIVDNLVSDSLISDMSAVAALLLTIAVFYAADKLPKKSTRFSSRIIRILR